MTIYQELLNDIENGQNFENNKAGWYTLFNTTKEIFCICYDADRIGAEVDKYVFYKNSRSAAKRLAQLINKG